MISKFIARIGVHVLGEYVTFQEAWEVILSDNDLDFGMNCAVENGTRFAAMICQQHPTTRRKFLFCYFDNINCNGVVAINYGALE